MPGSQPPGGQTPGAQPAGGLPGTQGQGEQPGTETDPTWDTLPPGGSAGGEETAGQPPAGSQSGSEESGGWESGVPGSASDGWETSNQLPGGDASRVPPMPSERGLPPGQADGTGLPGGSGADGELDKALKDFDGGILSERAVIQARSNERAGTGGTPADLPGSGDASGDVDSSGDAGDAQQTASYEPVGLPSQNMPQRAPPNPGASAVPDDVPDARDDDIIARQLREAAMNETDPELREKLWEEYRRYKGA